MIKTIKEFLTSKFLRNDLIRNKEEIKLSIGKILCEVFKDKNFDNIQDYEFKIFSQFGEDGIIGCVVKKFHKELSVLAVPLVLKSCVYLQTPIQSKGGSLAEVLKKGNAR